MGVGVHPGDAGDGACVVPRHDERRGQLPLPHQPPVPPLCRVCGVRWRVQGIGCRV